MSVIQQLDNFAPLKTYSLGHTPFQIEHFKTTSQRGSPKFEYWQHVVQLKAFWRSLKATELDLDDARAEVESQASWVFPWNKDRKKRALNRAKLKLEELETAFKEKSLEAQRHLDVIDRNYKEFVSLTEEEILQDEEFYWVTRLSRQIAFSALAAKTAINVGDLTAMASLPDALQKRVLQAVRGVLEDHARLEIGSRDGDTAARLQQSSTTGESPRDLP